MGSPPFALSVLQALLHSEHETALLVTLPDRRRGRGRSISRSPLAALADEAGIEVLQPETTRDEAFVRELARREPEVLVVASYGEILREAVLELAPQGALNVHASLLPRWRGASPIQHAILAGDPRTGVSIQRLVRALDAGDLLLSEATPIDAEETAGELLERLAALGASTLLRALDALATGQARFMPQDPDAVTLAPKLRKEDGLLDWSRPAAELARRVRAVTPWPGARTTVIGTGEPREIVVTRARLASAPELPPGQPSGQPAGTLIGSGDGCLVRAADDWLELLEVKPAGKAAMSGADFLRGARFGPEARMLTPIDS
jgi:methionyl-tRNA formyltransferase